MTFELAERSQVTAMTHTTTTSTATTSTAATAGNVGQAKTHKKPVKMSLTSFMGTRTTSANSLSSWADEMESHSPSSPSIMDGGSSGESEMMRDIVSGFEKGMTVSATRHVGIEQRRSSSTSHYRSTGRGGILASAEDDSNVTWRTKEPSSLSNGGGGRSTAEIRESPLSTTFASDKYGNDREDSFRGDTTSSWRDFSRRSTPSETSISGSPSLEKISDHPPYVAFVGNLPFNIEVNELERVFSPLTIGNVRIPKFQGKPKGFAYLEFSSAEDLKRALGKHGSLIQGRPIKMDVADGSRETAPTGGFIMRSNLIHGSDRSTPREDLTESQNWREQSRREPASSSSLSFQRDSRPPFLRGTEYPSPNEEGHRDREWQRRAHSPRYGTLERSTIEDTPSSPEPKVREKLHLLPRSMDSDSMKSTASAMTTRGSKGEEVIEREKPSPFGAARPIDETGTMKRAEEKLRQQEEAVSQKLKELEMSRSNLPVVNINRPTTPTVDDPSQPMATAESQEIIELPNDTDSTSSTQVTSSGVTHSSEPTLATSHSRTAHPARSGQYVTFRGHSAQSNHVATGSRRNNGFRADTSRSTTVPHRSSSPTSDQTWRNRSTAPNVTAASHQRWERVGDVSAARSLAAKSRLDGDSSSLPTSSTTDSTVINSKSNHNNNTSHNLPMNQNVFNMLSMDVTAEEEDNDHDPNPIMS